MARPVASRAVQWNHLALSRPLRLQPFNRVEDPLQQDSRLGYSRAMSQPQARDFIGSLHLVAAGGDPEDRQRIAVEALLHRFIDDARSWLGKDTERIRRQVVSLEDALRSDSTRPREDRCAELKEYARQLVADWLRDN